MISWPDSLIKDIARRRSVVYLGSGISRNSSNAKGESPKTWKLFLEFASANGGFTKDEKDVIDTKIAKGDYLLACELIRELMGHDRYINLLKDEFQRKKYDHAPIHEAIQKLDSRLVVSANFDQIYENYAKGITKGAVSVKNYNDSDLASCIRDSDDMILKIHGSIEQPNEMIFTQSEYAVARNMYPAFYQIFNALFVTRTFLFLGAGLNDPDIRLLLENYSFQYRWSKKHFFVIPFDQLSEIERKIHSDVLNLDFLLYDPANNHEELTDSLWDLVNKVDTYRNKLAGTQDW